MSQRLTIMIDVRRRSDRESVLAYVRERVEQAGGEIHAATSADKRGRGARGQIIADTPDAVALMYAVNDALDYDSNAYALDVMDDLAMGAFLEDGSRVGFANQDYRAERDSIRD